jgi:hypothetical protein
LTIKTPTVEAKLCLSRQHAADVEKSLKTTVCGVHTAKRGFTSHVSESYRSVKPVVSIYDLGSRDRVRMKSGLVATVP